MHRNDLHPPERPDLRVVAQPFEFRAVVEPPQDVFRLILVPSPNGFGTFRFFDFPDFLPVHVISSLLLLLLLFGVIQHEVFDLFYDIKLIDEHTPFR